MRRRSGWAAWTVALALHLVVALLLIWQTSQPSKRNSGGPAPRVSLRMVPAQASIETATVTRSISQELAPHHRPPQPTPTLPASTAAFTADEMRTAIAAPPTTAHAPLNLTLPANSASAVPRSMVNAALNDSRSNTRLTHSERFAAMLGTNTDRIEERMAEGMRVREGTSCALVYESRAAVVNPFNQVGVPMPKLAKPCP